MPVERIANYCPICGAKLEMQERYDKVRPVCPECDHTIFFDPKVAVATFVLCEDEVLLIKRAGDPGKGKWALPAGFIDPDEDPKAAAARETLEETGLHVKIDKLIDLLHRPDEDGLADIVIAYAAHVTGGTLHAGDDADAAAWFPKDELPAMALATTDIMIQRWLDGGL
jgi:ADP-ribose pyrophosphatase YjhB (NUDIX family)